MAVVKPLIGFFINAVGADGDDDESWYRQMIGDAEHGAALGYDAAWVVEHHFSDYQPTPNPMLVLAHIAARCPTLGLGTGVLVTPWHNPVRLVEEVAMLSLLTAAPLRIGLGRGNAPLEYEAFGVPMAEAKDRFQECWDVIQQAMQGLPFSYKGRYLQVPRDVTLRPRPRQDQVTFIGAIGHPTSAAKIAELGLPPLVNGGPSLDVHRQILAQWMETTRKRGGKLDAPRIASPLTIIADTDEEAYQLARRYVPRWYQLQLEHYAFDAERYANVPGYASFTDGQERRRLWSDPDNLDSLIDVSFIGSAETARRKAQIYLDIGYNYLLINTSTPGMPARWRRDWLTRFARDVGPHLALRSTPDQALSTAAE